MYRIMKSTANGIDELELDSLEKGCWIDIVSPSPEELHEVADATGIQMDFLSAALDDEEKSRIETEDDQILTLIDIPVLRSNKDYDTLPLGIIISADYIVTVCLEPNAVIADFSAYNSKMFSTFKKTRFLFQILYKSATLYLKYIRIIIKRTDEPEILNILYNLPAQQLHCNRKTAAPALHQPERAPHQAVRRRRGFAGGRYHRIQAGY